MPIAIKSEEEMSSITPRRNGRGSRGRPRSRIETYPELRIVALTNTNTDQSSPADVDMADTNQEKEAENGELEEANGSKSVPLEDDENINLNAQETYDQDQFEDIMSNFVCGTEFKTFTLPQIIPGAAFFQTWLDFSLGHYTLIPDADRSNILLSNLSLDIYRNPSRSSEPGRKAVVINRRISDDNHPDHRQSIALFRHRNVTLCPIFHLSAFFFYKYHIASDIPPDFSSKEKWYNVPLMAIRPFDPSFNKPPDSLKTGIDKIFSSFGYQGVFKSMMDLSTKSGIALARAKGVPQNEIELQGAKFYDAMYGIEPANGPDIARNFRVPSLEAVLLRDIFPWVDFELSKFENNDFKNKSGEHDYAAVKFLRLMKFLKLCFIQDMVVVSQEFPRSALSCHSFFSLPEFEKYRDKMIANIFERERQEHTSKMLNDVLPSIVRTEVNLAMQKIKEDLAETLQKHQEETNTLLQNIADSISNIASQLQPQSQFQNQPDYGSFSQDEPVSEPEIRTQSQSTAQRNSKRSHHRLKLTKVKSVRELVKDWINVVEPARAGSISMKWLVRSHNRSYHRRKRAFEYVSRYAAEKGCTIERAALLIESDIIRDGLTYNKWLESVTASVSAPSRVNISSSSRSPSPHSGRGDLMMINLDDSDDNDSFVEVI